MNAVARALWVITALAGVIVLAAIPALADERAETVYEFAIPPGPLPEAVAAFLADGDDASVAEDSPLEDDSETSAGTS